MKEANKILDDSMMKIAKLDLLINENMVTVKELEQQAIRDGKDPAKCQELSNRISSDFCRSHLNNRIDREILSVSKKVKDFGVNQELVRNDVNRIIEDSNTCLLDVLRLRYFLELQTIKTSVDRANRELNRDINKSRTDILLETTKISNECKSDINLKFDQVTNCYLTL